MKPNGTRSGQGASGEGFATVRVLRCLLLVCLASWASVASVAAADATTLSETLLVAGPGPSEPMPALEYYARRIDEVAASFGELPGALHEALWRPHGEPIPGGPGRLAFAAGVLLVSGMCVMWAVSRALSMLRVRIETSSGAAPRTGRFVRAIPRLMLDGFEVGAFGLGVLVAYVVMQPPHSVAAPLLNEVLIASLAILALSRVSRLLFAPRRAELRLLSMSDQAAGTWCRSLVTIGAIVMVLAAVGRGLGILGVDRDQLTALGIPLSLIPFSLLGVTFWRHRKSMADVLGSQLGFSGEGRSVLGGVLGLTALYIFVLWLVTIEGLVRGVPGVAYKVVASLAVVSIGIIVGWLAYHPVSVLFGALGPREANGRTSGEADLPLGEALPAVSTARIARLMRAIWASLLVAAAIATARIWGFGLAAFGIGDSLAGALVNIAAVLLLGYVSWALVLRWIDARLENAAHDTDETRSKRLRTLLPLLRMFIRIVITAMVIMITLSSLGVDIGPLLAGAGIVGIAIGFGAQSTVANVLTGVSFLLVDAFRVGDYVEVGSIRGTVEGMSLTTLRLRHHRGAVHTLPFAEIRSMTNYSRDWMLIRLEFRIPQATDLGLIKRLVKSIGQDLIQNPEFGKHFVEPLKSQGVRAVEDNAIVIGIKFVARPDAAFTIRREAYERIIKAFQANGIELVGRGVVVKVEGTDSVVPTAAGAAARDVIERGDGNTKEA